MPPPNTVLPPSAGAPGATPAILGAAPAPGVTPLPGATPLIARPLPGAPRTTHPSAQQPIIKEPATAGEDEEAPSAARYFQVWKSFQGDSDFMRRALMAGVLAALMCSYLGLYVILKRIVFVSVALAEMSSAGIALSLLLGASLPWFTPTLGAALFMLLGIVLFSVRWSPRRVPHDSYIGVLYAVATALGILLIATSAQGEGHMLELLQGQILTITTQEVWQMAGALAALALVHALFTKEFLLVSFDRDAASTLGFRAALWDLLLLLSIGVAIAFSIRSIGVLLTTALLILPGATALLLSNRMRTAWILAPILAVVPVPIGLHLSLLSQNLPASALIVAISFVLLLPALAFHRLRRGS